MPKLICEWCFGKMGVVPMYIPESPVLEWMEEKLIRIDNDFTQQELTKEEEYHLNGALVCWV